MEFWLSSGAFVVVMARPCRLLKYLELVVVGRLVVNTPGFVKCSDKGQIVIGFTNTCGFTVYQGTKKEEFFNDCFFVLL